ncbi:Lysosomal Pro-X carboxypeptidase, partial [Bienertia sinuspersici]
MGVRVCDFTFHPKFDLEGFYDMTFQQMVVHCFYGDSVPFGTIDLAKVNHQVGRCLSKDHALQDFTIIIQSLKTILSCAFSPVIVVGKGYSGGMISITHICQSIQSYHFHRFYGDSVPFVSIDFVMANHQVRRCLSTNQALQDFAVIIQCLKAILSCAFSPVIVMGKGYSGGMISITHICQCIQSYHF